jgi:hypothetical protein
MSDVTVILMAIDQEERQAAVDPAEGMNRPVTTEHS